MILHSKRRKYEYLWLETAIFWEIFAEKLIFEAILTCGYVGVLEECAKMDLALQKGHMCLESAEAPRLGSGWAEHK